MEKGDGMSFAEFTYPLLQAWDWWQLYNHNGVRLQIGGSDQYGNITAGMDAVKYISSTHTAPDVMKKTDKSPFGFTVPLLTTSSGAKFGKSAGNAIWLDEEMTSTFDLYGYFLRTSDEDVERYLKLFTFIPLEDIKVLVEEHQKNPAERRAQHRLASDFVELIHGAAEAVNVKAQHQMLFKKGPSADTADVEGQVLHRPNDASLGALKLPQINVNNKPKPHMKLPRSFIEKRSIGRVLYAAGLADSAAEGHRLCTQQAVHIGAQPGSAKQPMVDGTLTFVPVKLWFPRETQKHIADDNILILRRGKHNVRIIEVVDDEDFLQSGLTFPGWQAWKNDFHGALNDPEIEEDDQPDTLTEETRSYYAQPQPGSDEAEDRIKEYATPEDRIKELRENLRRQEDKRLCKLEDKFAPKGKFIGHGKPRGRAPPW